MTTPQGERQTRWPVRALKMGGRPRRLLFVGGAAATLGLVVLFFGALSALSEASCPPQGCQQASDLTDMISAIAAAVAAIVGVVGLVLSWYPSHFRAQAPPPEPPDSEGYL